MENFDKKYSYLIDKSWKILDYTSIMVEERTDYDREFTKKLIEEWKFNTKEIKCKDCYKME